MSHFSPTSLPTVKTMLAANAYGNMNTADKTKAEFDLGNTFVIQDEIRVGYKAFIKSQEQNHREQIAAVNRQINAIGNLTDTIDARFSALGAQIEITNTLLESINDSVMLPEFEKERQFYFNEGLKNLKLATRNIIYYNQALTAFIKAYKMDENDYKITYHIALIYLHSSENLDLVKADYFLKKTFRLVKGIDQTVFYDTSYQLGYCNFIQAKFETALMYFRSIQSVFMDLALLIMKSYEAIYDSKKLENYTKGLDKLLVIDIIETGDFEDNKTVKPIFDEVVLDSKIYCKNNIKELKMYMNTISNKSIQHASLFYSYYDDDDFKNYISKFNEIMRLFNKKEYLKCESLIENEIDSFNYFHKELANIEHQTKKKINKEIILIIVLVVGSILWGYYFLIPFIKAII